jgi:hypothetical protein
MEDKQEWEGATTELLNDLESIAANELKINTSDSCSSAIFNQEFRIAAFVLQGQIHFLHFSSLVLISSCNPTLRICGETKLYVFSNELEFFTSLST